MARHQPLPRERRRVVITGIGAVSAAGVGAEPLWRAVIENRSCLRPITRFDASEMVSQIAGEVPDFEATRYIEARQKPKRMARYTQFAVAAAREAIADARLDPAEFQGHRVAVLIGSSLGTSEYIEDATRHIEKNGARAINIASAASGNMQAAPAAVVELLGVPTANATCITNTCSSGVDAVSLAVEFIRSGRYDMVIAGGAEAPLSYTMMAAITAAGICSRRNEAPGQALRPFDRERGGGVLGEGAGVLVFETLDSAQERGAVPYAEIAGTSSHPDLRREEPTSGLEFTMRAAMENAGRQARDIDFISAWGCGDANFDRNETKAIKTVFGEHAYRLAVGSIKGAIGIPLGAAGAIQLVTTAMAHRRDVLPPTVNCVHPDIDCDLDYIEGSPRRVRLRNSLLNSHGMSGGNTTLLLSSLR